MIDVNKLFDKWSGDVHPKIFQNLKNRIQITDVKPYSIGYIQIGTLTESRSVYALSKQLNHKRIPKSGEHIDFDSIDPWIFKSDLTDDFVELTQVMEIPNTERIIDCHHCHGDGMLPCDTCAATGSLNCQHCNGTGNTVCGSCNGSGIEGCSNCSGKGIIQIERSRAWYTEDGIMHQKIVLDGETCPSCSGKGHIPCASCNNGAIPCRPCEGLGQTTCEVCQGQGMIVCEQCKGKKSQLSTLNIELKRTVSEETLVLETPEFIRRFNAFNLTPPDDIWGSNSARHHSEKGSISQITLYDLLSGEFIAQYDFLKRAKSLLSTNQAILSNEKIVRQRISYVVVDYLDISYLFEGETYSVLANTMTETFHVKTNPFLSTLDGVFNEARHAFEKRDYSKAEKLVSQSRSDYLGTEKEKATLELMEKIKKSKNRQVTFGALIGLQLLILIKFISIINVSRLLFDVIIPAIIIGVAAIIIEKIKPNIPLKNASSRYLLGVIFITLFFLIMQVFI